MRRALKKSPIAILDTETTGLDPEKHEIIEIAIMRIDDGKREIWHTKISPQSVDSASPKALSINGYNDFEWINAPTMKEALPKIKKQLRGCVLVGHNLDFDLAFLKKAYTDHSARGMGFHYKIDTMALAYEHLAGIGLNSLSLKSVCTFLGVSNEGEHTAEADVARCYEVFSKLSRASGFRRLVWRLRMLRA